jgi:hypothetical protein
MASLITEHQEFAGTLYDIAKIHGFSVNLSQLNFCQASPRHLAIFIPKLKTAVA